MNTITAYIKLAGIPIAESKQLILHSDNNGGTVAPRTSVPTGKKSCRAGDFTLLEVSTDQNKQRRHHYNAKPPMRLLDLKFQELTPNICLHFFLVAVLLVFGMALPVKAMDFSKYPNIITIEEGEDATSTFYYIFGSDQNKVIQGIISVWNGGCCQAPLIEEFQRYGSHFELISAYTISPKLEDYTFAILCDKELERTTLEATRAGRDGSLVKHLLEYEIIDGAVFPGC